MPVLAELENAKCQELNLQPGSPGCAARGGEAEREGEEGERERERRGK